MSRTIMGRVAARARVVAALLLLFESEANAQQAAMGEPMRAMGMNDAAPFAKVSVDHLEWLHGDGSAGLAWEAEGWYGGDYSKVWVKTERDRAGDGPQDARAELLWDRIVSRWWSAQAGGREDFGGGPDRTWLALGIQGLAPYFFAVEATAYVGGEGRTAARFRAKHELLFTQRLILQSELETNLYGKDDPERRIGAGFSDVQLGLRLRYELRRELAPYLGVRWQRSLGKTGDLERMGRENPSGFQALAGIRFWF